MKDVQITENIKYIGADDKTIDIFEGQYKVPNGISYNSYLIKDEQNVIFDTVDKRQTNKWNENLNKMLEGEELHYLIISHLEPDHSANIQTLTEKYPNMKIVGNEKTFTLISQFFNIKNLEQRKIVVKQGDSLNIGKHTLQFYMAPMVHWPEVMLTYESTEKILFSADAFGKFGTLDTDEQWLPEARRYYFNIVGKYGIQVQALLKKLSGIEIKTICPLHGPILKKDLGYYLEKYNIWSSYLPENEGIFIAYSSIYGNTKKAVEKLEEILKTRGVKNIQTCDLTRQDVSEAIANAFYYDKLILASSSYNMGIFPPMEQFLRHLEGKNYQNRKIAIIENGTWAPSAAKGMKEIISKMKNITIYEPTITIKTKMNSENINQIEELVDNILK